MLKVKNPIIEKRLDEIFKMVASGMADKTTYEQLIDNIFKNLK